MEAELQNLLAAKAVELGPIDLQAKDLDYQPITKLNMAYIVCGILVNDEGEILMIQEAKRSCRGMWYLPAGRIDPNEHIEEAVKREVLEETGIEFEPTTLIAVETCNAFWYRFVFAGKATGGSLKTLEQQDAESLQARWCSMQTIKSGRKNFPLRAGDVLPLIEVGLKHRAATTPSQHPSMMSVISPHTKVLLRLVCLYLGKDSSDIQLLVGQKTRHHLPVAVVFSADRNMDWTLHRLMDLIFSKTAKVQRTIHGVLSVEYNGKPAQVHDGMCISLMVSVATKDEKQPAMKNTDYFQWQSIEGAALKQEVLERSEPGKTVPFFMLV